MRLDSPPEAGEGRHECEQKEEESDVQASTGVAIFAGTRVNAAVDRPSIHEDRVLALVAVLLRTGANRDESTTRQVHANDLGTVVRKDAEPLTHASLSRDT